MFFLSLSGNADNPSDIDLVGSQAFLLPGGLALGNLARASQASGVPAVCAGHALVGIAASKPGL